MSTSMGMHLEAMDANHVTKCVGKSEKCAQKGVELDADALADTWCRPMMIQNVSKRRTVPQNVHSFEQYPMI